MNSTSSQSSVQSGPFAKSLEVPASKSYANRQLILAAITEGPSKIKFPPKSTDVLSMIRCLKKTGLKINQNESENSITIENSFPECEQSGTDIIELETGDGGTTNRFIATLLARGKRKYRLTTSGAMKERPVSELINSMTELGVSITKGSENEPFWIEIQGPYKISQTEIRVDSNRSTQFATGLAMCLADHDIEVIADGMENSRKYFELTLDLIEKFKNGEKEFTVPVDFSSISYPLALGLVKDNVTVTNCFSGDTNQADSVFLNVIKRMGGTLEWRSNGLFIGSPKTLSPIDIDCSQFPDLVPTLAFVCSYANGRSRLGELEVLHHKESDRVKEIINVLELFDIEHEYDPDSENIWITGKDRDQNKNNPTPYKEFNAPNDHRIIMMCYLFMRMNSGGLLKNSHHVKKSFDGFFEIMG